MPLTDLGRIMVISPHLDDAVFGCGEFLSCHPSSTVVTVFAGTPPTGMALTEWDAACGFVSACEAMVARRNEDASALLTLSAKPVWLRFLDSQYCTPDTGTRDDGAIAAALAAMLEYGKPDTVLFPLGLFHSDHECVHRAMLRVVAGGDIRTCLVYEDALYRCMDGLLQERLAGLHRAGICATPLAVSWRGDGEVKMSAIRCYESQLKAFGEDGYADCVRPERFWRLSAAHSIHAA